MKTLVLSVQVLIGIISIPFLVVATLLDDAYYAIYRMLK